MSYFLTNIEDVNNLFIKDDFLQYQFEFSKTDKTICNAIKCYTLEYFNDEDFEKIPLNPKEYNSENKNHYLKWDINYLDTHLTTSDFEDDIKQGVQKDKEHYLEKLEDKLLNLYTELQIKNELNKFLEQVIKSIEALKRLKVNKYQKITINVYLESYRDILIYLNSKYENYLPKPKTNSFLEKFINHSKTTNFLTLETNLIERGFIQKVNNRLYWSNKKGYKIKMINFCRLLEHHNYLNQYLTVGKLIKFLEKRYNINVGEQAKPSKYLTKSIKLIEPDFFFLRF